MAETQSDIRREIEITRAAMAEKIEMLENRVTGIVEEAKRSVNPKYQTKRHPWLMMSVSVLAGYMLNNMFFKGASGNGRKRKMAADAYSMDGSSHAPWGQAQGKPGMIQSLATAVALSLLRDLGSGVVRKARAHFEKERPQRRSGAP